MRRTLLVFAIFCLPLLPAGCGRPDTQVIDVSNIPPEWADDESYDELDVEP